MCKLYGILGMGNTSNKSTVKRLVEIFEQTSSAIQNAELLQAVIQEKLRLWAIVHGSSESSVSHHHYSWTFQKSPQSEL